MSYHPCYLNTPTAVDNIDSYTPAYPYPYYPEEPVMYEEPEPISFWEKLCAPFKREKCKFAPRGAATYQTGGKKKPGVKGVRNRLRNMLKERL